MMRLLGYMLLVSCGWVVSGLADPVSLQLGSQFVTTGQIVNEDIVISGLGLPPEVGSFDIFIGFDPSLLAPTTVQFGSLLGDPSLSEALTTFSLGSDFVEAVEVSLLSTAQLDALQSNSFTLATVSFNALESGTAHFAYLGGPVDDGSGQLIFGSKTVAPEPALWLPLSGALLGVLVGRRRRSTRVNWV